MDPAQARRFVGPDLGRNCLQRLSADDTGRYNDKLCFGGQTHHNHISIDDESNTSKVKPYLLHSFYKGAGLQVFSTLDTAHHLKRIIENAESLPTE